MQYLLTARYYMQHLLRTVEARRTQVSFTIDFYMQVDSPVELILRTVEARRTQVSFPIDFYMQVAHQRSVSVTSRQWTKRTLSLKLSGTSAKEPTKNCPHC